MANDTRTIGERIAAGEYHSRLAWPNELPSRLRRRGLEAEARAAETQRNARSSDETRLQQQLRADLEGDSGTTPAQIGQRKADLLWAKAWDHGHSAGLHEVAFWYVDLAELVL